MTVIMAHHGDHRHPMATPSSTDTDLEEVVAAAAVVVVVCTDHLAVVALRRFGVNVVGVMRALPVYPCSYGTYLPTLPPKICKWHSEGSVTFVTCTSPVTFTRNNQRGLPLSNMQRLKWQEKHVTRWTNSESRAGNWKSSLLKSAARHRMKCVAAL